MGDELQGIPPSAASTYERLLRAPERAPEALRRSVDRYLETILEAAQTRTHLDTDLAKRITKACHGLIDLLPGAVPDHKRHIVAAVEYFLLPRDGEDDLAYADGLDDDAMVVTAVANALGRPDLHVPVPQR